MTCQNPRGFGRENHGTVQTPDRLARPQHAKRIAELVIPATAISVMASASTWTTSGCTYCLAAIAAPPQSRCQQ